MESRVKFLGHPIHPMLIVFPFGLLVTAVIFDIVYLLNGEPIFATIAYWNITAGLIGGLAAAIFGFWDWTHIPANTRAKRIGILHGLGNLVVVLFFFLSWLIRRQMPDYVPGTLALAASFAGFALATLTGWLGGELVDRLGVGVDRGANLNAPISLSGKPADSHLPEPSMVTGSAIPVTGDDHDIDASEQRKDRPDSAETPGE